MKENYRVTGMTCAACSAAVERAVKKVPGVQKAEVNLLDGHPISCKSRVKVDEALLDLYPDGVSLLNCAMVEIDPALEPSEILEQLYLSNCALVRCTAAQQGAVQAAGGAARIQLTDQATEEEAPDEDTQIFECAQYVL